MDTPQNKRKHVMVVHDTDSEEDPPLGAGQSTVPEVSKPPEASTADKHSKQRSYICTSNNPTFTLKDLYDAYGDKI